MKKFPYLVMVSICLATPSLANYDKTGYDEGGCNNRGMFVYGYDGGVDKRTCSGGSGALAGQLQFVGVDLQFSSSSLTFNP